MTSPRLHTSTARRLVLYTLLCSSAVAVLATAIQLYLDWRRDVDVIEEQLGEIQRSHVPSLTRSLWVEDRELLRLQLEGVMALPDMAFAEVRTPAEAMMALGQHPADDSLVRELPLVYVYRGRDVRLGTLTLAASLSHAYTRLGDRLLVLLATNAGKALLVGFFMLLIFRRLVTRHLDHMARYTAQLGAGHLDEPLVLDRPRPAAAEDDELEACARALDEMRLALRAALDERARLAGDLEGRVRELESFSYSLSHDLSAPLRTIENFTEILCADDLAPEAPEAGDMLRRIQASCARMRHLLEAMLTLSGVARRTLHAEPVDLSALAAESAERLRALHPGRAVAVEVAPGMVARGDEALLALALDNLLGNAWKFTARTEGARVVVGHDERAGAHTYFVRDNGIGFDESFRDRIFLPFQRLHGPSEYPGSGIGLSIVSTVVRRHGGRVWAEGRPGGGATFYFTLGAP